MNFYIETVGCQMNTLDSELAAAELINAGWKHVESRKDAQLVIFNTCSVREHAEEKIYSALGRLKHWKTQKPGSLIVVMGCMAQKDKELVFKRAPCVDVVVGPGQIDQLVALVERAAETNNPQIAVSLDRFQRRDDPKATKESFRQYDPIRMAQTRPRVFQAMTRIMFGCNKFCSYCVVPSVRGPEQSRPPKDILREIRTLADQGALEIVLLGQTVNSYRYVEGEKVTRLCDLLVEIDKIPEIKRVRFVSAYPTDMTDDLLQAVRDLRTGTPYLHVPAQHGANSMLQRMRRHYTVEQYKDLVERIYATIPGASITSDFIVGFSGETEEEFQQTVDLVRFARFKNSYIFKYSERPGNEAARKFPDDIPEEVKKRRNNELLAVQNEVSYQGNQQFLGKTVEILVEGPSKREMKSVAQEETLYEEGQVVDQTVDTMGALTHVPNVTTSLEEMTASAARLSGATPTQTVQMTGRTPCDRIVVFNGSRAMAGSFQKIKIAHVGPMFLAGDLVEE